jgi:methionyl aminopeptidase
VRDVRQKLGPNEPCWCGSGRKYKKCHMGSDAQGGAVEPPRASSKRNPLLLNEDERNAMRRAGQANAALLDEVRAFIKPGIKTKDIDDLVVEWTHSHGYKCATIGYRGRRGAPPFPGHCCTSPNEVVCHGIPGDYVLKDGDIVNVDLTTIVDGWHGDQSETFLIGEVSDEALRVVQCSFDAMWLAIEALRPYSKVIEIGRAIVRHARQQGFSVVEDYQGHGIGRQFHQKPHIPHFPDMHHGHQVLEPGMCFTVEPMINAGAKRCVEDRKDGWTVYTADGKLSAQFEHTILMTEQGPEVLTLTRHGPRKGHRFTNRAPAERPGIAALAPRNS